MKKICIALSMVAALTVSLSTYAQDSKKEATPKAKTEQVEEKPSCCAEKKEKTCCKEKGKETKSSQKEAGEETKSCGKKK